MEIFYGVLVQDLPEKVIEQIINDYGLEIVLVIILISALTSAAITYLFKWLEQRNEPQIHISKAKYDLELAIYRELWEKLDELFVLVITQSNRAGLEKDQILERNIEASTILIKNHFNEYGKFVRKNNPFYAEEVNLALQNHDKVFRNYWKQIPRTMKDLDTFLSQTEKGDLPYYEGLNAVHVAVEQAIRKRFDKMTIVT